MRTLTIDMRPEIYQKLSEQARKAGKGPEALGASFLRPRSQQMGRPKRERQRRSCTRRAGRGLWASACAAGSSEVLDLTRYAQR